MRAYSKTKIYPYSNYKTKKKNKMMKQNKKKKKEGKEFDKSRRSS